MADWGAAALSNPGARPAAAPTRSPHSAETRRRGRLDPTLFAGHSLGEQRRWRLDAERPGRCGREHPASETFPDAGKNVCDILDEMQPGPCEQIMVGPSSVIPDPAPLLPCCSAAFPCNPASSSLLIALGRSSSNCLPRNDFQLCNGSALPAFCQKSPCKIPPPRESGFRSREFPVEIGLNPIETDEGTMILSDRKSVV